MSVFVGPRHAGASEQDYIEVFADTAANQRGGRHLPCDDGPGPVEDLKRIPKEETMSDLKVDPTPMELGERDRARLERLDRMAERGEIRPVGRPRRCLASSGPISAEEFEATMALGRPRSEEGTRTVTTWRVRTPEDLDKRAKAQAAKEHLPLSALVRKAMNVYLQQAAA